jgi:hypothetical protein
VIGEVLKGRVGPLRQAGFGFRVWAWAGPERRAEGGMQAVREAALFQCELRQLFSGGSNNSIQVSERVPEFGD